LLKPILQIRSKAHWFSQIVRIAKLTDKICGPQEMTLLRQFPYRRWAMSMRRVNPIARAVVRHRVPRLPQHDPEQPATAQRDMAQARHRRIRAAMKPSASSINNVAIVLVL
jgi:hypothetical protein